MGVVVGGCKLFLSVAYLAVSVKPSPSLAWWRVLTLFFWAALHRNALTIKKKTQNKTNKKTKKLEKSLSTRREEASCFEHQSTRVTLHPWSNFIFSITSKHDLDIGHTGHLATNKGNDSVKHSTYEVLAHFQ